MIVVQVRRHVGRRRGGDRTRGRDHRVRAATRQPVVVVCALAGATNALLAIAEQAAKGQLIGALRGVEALRERHLRAVAAAARGRSGRRRRHLRRAVSAMFDELAHARRSALDAGPPDAAQPRRDRLASASSCRRVLVVAAFQLRAACRPSSSTPATSMITDDALHARRAADRSRSPRRRSDVIRPILRGRAAFRSWAASSARRRARHHHDARARRLATTARRCSARRCRRRRSRSGPTSTACSRPIRASSQGARLIERIRFDEASRARVVRRQGAAPEHDRARRHDRASRCRSYNSRRPRGHGHAHHVRRAAASRDGDRRQERRDLVKVRSAADAARRTGSCAACSRSSSGTARRSTSSRRRRSASRSRSTTRRTSMRSWSTSRELGDVSVERNRGIVALVGAGLGDGSEAMAQRARCARRHAGAHAVAERQRHQPDAARRRRAGDPRRCGGCTPRSSAIGDLQ